MLDVAIDAAKAGGQLAYQYFGKTINVRYKSDNSPVTIADIEAEKLIRKIIAKKFPDHGIMGEELPSVNPKAKYQWVIDPIDGTKQYVRGIPFWTTYVAVLENGKPIIGVCYSPTTNEIVLAQHGKGTYLNNKRIHVSKVSEMKSAYLAHSSILHFERKGRLRGFLNLCRSTQHYAGYRDWLGYYLLLTGKIDIMIEDKDAIHDIAVPAILIEEAGGRFSDFSGKFSLTSDCALATNGLLHDKVLKIINE